VRKEKKGEKQKVNSDGLDALPLSNKDVIELSYLSYTLYKKFSKKELYLMTSRDVNFLLSANVDII
jgi:hypothetical protein